MDIKQWQDIIKNKRKQTTFHDYVRDLASWLPLVLHKNNGMISRFPETDRIKPVIDFNDFDNNVDSLLDHGIEYDFDQDFFHNFQKLFKSINLWNLNNFANNENASFSDAVYNGKNVYLCSTVISGCENILYSLSVKDHCKEVLNSMMIFDNCEIIYKSRWVMKSFKIFYSNYIYNSNNIWFSSNLNGCSECLFCDGLDNQSYCINNQQLEKDEYLKQKKEILSKKELFLNYYVKVNQIGNNIGSKNSRWNFNLYSEDIIDGHYTYQVKWWKNLILVWWENGDEDMYDCFTAGSLRATDFYGVMWAGINADNVYCSCHIDGCSNIYYSYKLWSCSYCLGCIGLKNKQYCILNKQYSREERYKLANKILEQMNNNWLLWEFFPWWLNPMYFNDTCAAVIKDFEKKEILDKWFLWHDGEVKVDVPSWADVISIADLDNYQELENNEWKIDSEIMKKVVADDKWNYYRIVKMEYDFLMKYWLPLPRQHWMDRIKEHLQVN